MEILDDKVNEKSTVAGVDCFNKNSDVKQSIVNVDNQQLCDNHLSVTMKEGTILEMSPHLNKSKDKEVTAEDEDFGPCANMSVDNSSKEESDLSDYGEENTTCQLANQALRAKLLNSAANAAVGKDSKLRVSVFDHRTIPKKFIMPKKVDLYKPSPSLDSTSNGQTAVRPQNLNSAMNSESENKRKLSSLSYTVLKAGKIYSRENSAKTSPTSPNVDGENDVRTRFDILLRNLIGDVNEMQMETAPTPATFSSGYESDYPQNRDLEGNRSKSESNSSLKYRENDKENVSAHFNQNFEPALGYISDAHVLKQRAATLQGFSSLPSFPIVHSDPNTNSLKRCETRDVPQLNSCSKESDSQGFNYAQRHNYKLTKVTRNMYEIIHDLQNGEKTSNDCRKRSRKDRRRCSQENNSANNENGNCSARENRSSRGRIQSDTFVLDNKPDQPPVTMRHTESAPHSFSGAVVRCVRRPLCNDPPSIQHNLSHSDSGNRLVAAAVNNNSNKVQNDLRNLLCGTPEVMVSSDDIHGQQRNQSAHLVDHNTPRELPLSTDNRSNQTGHSVTDESSLSSPQRRPTLSQQFQNRPKPDDHVYETIPGDEKFYEEWKKMRENPKIPKIRRFTTIPDLPGTFIPKEPPALPERKYLNGSSQPLKDRDSYILMGDMNSNFPGEVNLNTSVQKDSGYTSVASDKILDPRFFQCYPFPYPDDHGPSGGRNDETSDGYCSIDNLSLLRENFTDTSFPELPSRDWKNPHSSSGTFPRLPPKNDYFLSPMNKEEYREFQNSQELFRNEIPRVLGRQQSRDDDVGITFRADPNKPVFQATYV